jgi:hypothetical protein
MMKKASTTSVQGVKPAAKKSTGRSSGATRVAGATRTTKVVSAPKKKVQAKAVTTVVATRKRVVTTRVNRTKKSTTSKLGLYSRRTLRDILLSRALRVASRAFVGVVMVSAAMYGVYSFASNTFAGDVIISKSEIVSRVGKLTSLPAGTPDAVVRVQDADTLKKQNSFYENVKEGDYIIMYPSLAVIYSLRTDSLVAIKRIEK